MYKEIMHAINKYLELINLSLSCYIIPEYSVKDNNVDVSKLALLQS